jgi:hypothetical protein
LGGARVCIHNSHHCIWMSILFLLGSEAFYYYF